MTAKEEHRLEVFGRDKHECRAAGIHVCGGRLTAEHVIPVTRLRDWAIGLGPAVSADDLIRDGRNGIILCFQANLNRRTTVRLQRGDLPAHVFAFADDWGLTWYLDKHYPEPCRRCGGKGSRPAGEDTCSRCDGDGREP